MAAVIAVGPTLTYIASGTDITFEWDANTEENLAGYRLYMSNTSGVYEYGVESNNYIASIEAGTEAYEQQDVPAGTHYWVLTAYDTEGNESGPSNEVTYP